MSDKIESVEKPAQKQAKQDDALAAKVRGLEKNVASVVKYLEQMFKFDINKDGKIGAAIQPTLGLIAAITVGLVMTVSALSPLSPSNNLWNLVGPQSTNNLVDVDRSGNMRVQGTMYSSATQIVTAATSAATVGALTVQTNATVGGTLGVTGIATFAATQTVFSAAAVANTNAAVPLQGISVRVNGTNYVIKLYPVTGP